MDLALELGMPYEELARTMTEREFVHWQVYMGRRMLPTRRLEVYLAQLTFHVARAWGGAQNTKVTDYLLFDHREQDERPMTEDEQLEEAIQTFNFKPRLHRRKEEGAA